MNQFPKNLLIVAYEFPPSAGGGVQRISKLARYLPESGWRPHVLCGTPVWGRPTDASLLAPLGDTPITRLANHDPSAAIARLLRPLKRSRTPSAGQGPAATGASATGRPLSTRLVRRFMLDPAALWARRVPAAAVRLHRETPFDAVLASGPPHSALVAGARAARMLGVPFIADVRDPWASNPGYRFPDSATRDARSLALHREVMSTAALALNVSDPITAESTAAGAARSVTVPNGFDPADLPRWAPTPGPLRIAFMGRFYGSTDPTPFFDGVALAVARGGAAADLEIDVLGQTSAFVAEAIASRGIGDRFITHGFRPHAEALAIVARADAGLVALTDHPGAEANYTGKLFEYLGMGLPVLLVGPPHGVAADLLAQARAGVTVAYGDAEGVADELERMAEAKQTGAPRVESDPSVVSRFDRRTQAAFVAKLLDEVLA